VPFLRLYVFIRRALIYIGRATAAPALTVVVVVLVRDARHRERFCKQESEVNLCVRRARFLSPFTHTHTRARVHLIVAPFRSLSSYLVRAGPSRSPCIMRVGSFARLPVRRLARARARA